MNNKDNIKIGIIGLGYVGLPLAIEFSKKYDVMGFDIKSDRISELSSGKDSTLELAPEDFLHLSNIVLTSSIQAMAQNNVFIVTVPTPIDKHKKPDLGPLISASKMIGSILKRGDIVIYESTVYPGATEEDCVPILEETSGLKYNKDFSVGYSPERINPGDKEHRLTNILKITSGSNDAAAIFIDKLYNSIISAGTFKVSSIKVAEAAKVIENTQRDINIALINELAIIFNKLEIDTGEVLEAAGTKWNFLPFLPGLVGGHCIGVDPYYLTFKAISAGYHPEIILAGRKTNDDMSQYVVSQLIKKMISKNISIENAKILIMGFTFKENCPDIRNTKVIDIYNELKKYKISVDIWDPWCNENEALKEYNIEIVKSPKQGNYDGIVIAVSHNEFKLLGIDQVRKYGKDLSIVYDLKYLFPKKSVDLRL
jgi:UDP-N-acetyl-D-galactosamine dehydrogenase